MESDYRDMVMDGISLNALGGKDEWIAGGRWRE